jgi:GAF domain-containing protein
LLEDHTQARRLGGAVVGYAQPIVRDGRAVGVLVVGYTRARRAVPERAATAAQLFAAEASVAMERAQRLAIARERRAIDINDNIVQGLTVAKYAIGQGHVEEGARAIDDTLRRARQLITDQLTEATAGQGGPRPGDLVRETRVEGLSADDDDASSAPVKGR